MPISSVLTTAAGFLGRVGSQALVSLAASAAVAGCLALPGLMNLREPAPAAVEAAAWVSPVAANGKIRARHHDAVDDDAALQALSRRGLMSPAAAVMPMTVGWSQPTAERPSPALSTTVQALEPLPVALRAASVLPPRRPTAPVEIARAAPEPQAPAHAAPLQLVGAVAEPSASDAPRPPATILGRALPGPVASLGSAVSGAAGLVGAAGSWTVARAASLVPGL